MFSTFWSSFFLGQYFQAVLGHTALRSGLAILPLAVMIMMIIGIGLGTATGLATDLVMSVVPVSKAGVS